MLLLNLVFMKTHGTQICRLFQLNHKNQTRPIAFTRLALQNNRKCTWHTVDESEIIFIQMFQWTSLMFLVCILCRMCSYTFYATQSLIFELFLAQNYKQNSRIIPQIFSVWFWAYTSSPFHLFSPLLYFSFILKTFVLLVLLSHGELIKIMAQSFI